MNFEFSDEQRALRDQARKFLADRGALGRARQVLEGGAPFDQALWREMAEMGWQGTAIPERDGGAGFGYLELCVIAEELGRCLAPTPFSSSVYLFTEAVLHLGTDEQRRRLLPALASGETVGCLALAEGLQAPTSTNLAARVRDGRVSGVKMPVADGGQAHVAVVAATDEARGGVALGLVDLTAAGVSREAVATVDPSRPHARIRFEGASFEPIGAPGQGWVFLERLLDRAAVLMAFEQVGGAEAALHMGRDYALGRFAFGRPIGSFQAIKHKLADVYVAVELARSNAYYGAWALSTQAPELPIAAAAARVSASQAFAHAARENVQTHGGMGFTWEFDCHLYYRRAELLGLQLGGVRRWKEALIARIEAARAA
jgi:alkylation response protein AidB-like acyl-CoA dehydrogenase